MFINQIRKYEKWMPQGLRIFAVRMVMNIIKIYCNSLINSGLLSLLPLLS